MNAAAVARAAWGTFLLLAPGVVIRHAGGTPADGTSKAVGRVLGARHLAQALVVGRAGTRGWLLAGVCADALHSFSMAGLAALSVKHRRLAALDAAFAAGWAVSGILEARRKE